MENQIDGTKFHDGPDVAETKRIDVDKDDRGMILHPNLWPKWPYLPVKRRLEGGSFPETGVIWIGTKFNIYFVNLFDMPKSAEEFKATNHIPYNNVDELIADGWIVD
jgi:hypothetical protein